MHVTLMQHEIQEAVALYLKQTRGLDVAMDEQSHEITLYNGSEDSLDDATAEAKVTDAAPRCFSSFALRPLDGKFRGTVYRHTDGMIVSPQEWVVFLAKDNAFPPTLRFYREACERLGADAEQLAAVDRLIARVDEWREKNPLSLKVPDAAVGECH